MFGSNEGEIFLKDNKNFNFQMFDMLVICDLKEHSQQFFNDIHKKDIEKSFGSVQVESKMECLLKFKTKDCDFKFRILIYTYLRTKKISKNVV